MLGHWTVNELNCVNDALAFGLKSSIGFYSYGEITTRNERPVLLNQAFTITIFKETYEQKQ